MIRWARLTFAKEVEILKDLSLIARGLPLPRSRRYVPRRLWTEKEQLELRRLYPDTKTSKLARRFHRRLRAVYAMAKKLGLRKSEAFLASADACRLRRGDNVGAAYRFKKGQEPPNKGLRRPGYAPGRMAETQFRKGQLSHTWVPVGTEVLDPDGYLKRKVSDDRTRPSRFNWRFVHVLTWEAKHGPIPRGFAVAFKNGNKADLRDDNLELVSRQELMRRNSVHNLPPALAEVVQLRAVLVRQIRKRASA